jgi:replication initiation and membrane attachment protein
MMLRNEPYTRLLRTFFPGAVPDNLLDIFTKIDLNYKLPGEVINVLIHYLMSLLTSNTEQRINRNFVEAIASNMLMKQINTYEKAVGYIRVHLRAARWGEPQTYLQRASSHGQEQAGNSYCAELCPGRGRLG